MPKRDPVADYHARRGVSNPADESEIDSDEHGDGGWDVESYARPICRRVVVVFGSFVDMGKFRIQFQRRHS